MTSSILSEFLDLMYTHPEKKKLQKRIEILKAIHGGMKQKDIVSQLQVSEHTVCRMRTIYRHMSDNLKSHLLK